MARCCVKAIILRKVRIDMRVSARKFLIAGLLGVSLVGSSCPVWAAPAWSLPERGLKLETGAKQAHVLWTNTEMNLPSRKNNIYLAA